MPLLRQQHMKVPDAGQLAFQMAGDRGKLAVLLTHGFPNSSRMFDDVIEGLADIAYVIAPDLPGFGQSDVLPTPSFAAFSRAISALLDHLEIKRRYIYLHDFGAPVGLDIAMRAPELVSGLFIQNANAHRTGFGPQWDQTLGYWVHPTKENETAATAHLTLEGTRDQYVAGVPQEVASKIVGEPWLDDWAVMNLSKRMETQRALIADYANHAARFDEIAQYLKAHQPPALMLWGRHDAFFDIGETLSWMQDLPRMEAHIYDAGHFLLETHAAPALALMRSFIERNEAQAAAT